MRKTLGFSLIELLVALTILGLLLGVVLGFTQTSSRLEKRQRALALLAEDLSLTATVLAREVYLAGFRLQTGNALEISGNGSPTLTIRFFCEPGMELYCPTTSMNSTRSVSYRLQSSTLYWGACSGENCQPTADNPVSEGVLVFRIAFHSGAGWSKSPVVVNTSVTGATPRIQAVAIYLLVQSPLRVGGTRFTPGSTVTWDTVPDGSTLESILVSGIDSLNDNYPLAERLVVIQTPNLSQ
ncbi:MAG: prepilin-type N-terminal cleavage/methylation domain-containing protein [Thermus sp.]|nr:prepilin-type N-terminal cleavage/methylation domain-containing protein [Thermus sp.]